MIAASNPLFIIWVSVMILRWQTMLRKRLISYPIVGNSTSFKFAQPLEHLVFPYSILFIKAVFSKEGLIKLSFRKQNK
jgi:hypothetical protein